jgi:hypothetical protein
MPSQVEPPSTILGPNVQEVKEPYDRKERKPMLDLTDRVQAIRPDQQTLTSASTRLVTLYEQID